VRVTQKWIPVLGNSAVAAEQAKAQKRIWLLVGKLKHQDKRNAKTKDWSIPVNSSKRRML